MERLTRTDGTALAATAMAQDFNDELTVILSSAWNALAALEPGHPARIEVSEMQSAARRCARKCALVLDFSARRGAAPVPLPLEAVVDW